MPCRIGHSVKTAGCNSCEIKSKQITRQKLKRNKQIRAYRAGDPLSRKAPGTKPWYGMKCSNGHTLDKRNSFLIKSEHVIKCLDCTGQAKQAQELPKVPECTQRNWVSNKEPWHSAPRGKVKG